MELGGVNADERQGEREVPEHVWGAEMGVTGHRQAINQNCPSQKVPGGVPGGPALTGHTVNQPNLSEFCLELVLGTFK